MIFSCLIRIISLELFRKVNDQCGKVRIVTKTARVVLSKVIMYAMSTILSRYNNK